MKNRFHRATQDRNEVALVPKVKYGKWVDLPLRKAFLRRVILRLMARTAKVQLVPLTASVIVVRRHSALRIYFYCRSKCKGK